MDDCGMYLYGGNITQHMWWANIVMPGGAACRSAMQPFVPLDHVIGATITVQDVVVVAGSKLQVQWCIHMHDDQCCESRQLFSMHITVSAQVDPLHVCNSDMRAWFIYTACMQHMSAAFTSTRAPADLQQR